MRNTNRKIRGHAILELCLSFTVIWLLFTGVYQFGYSLYLYNNLATAVTNGARYAARADLNPTSPSSFTTAVKNVVVYGSPTGGSSTLAPGLTTSHVLVTWSVDSEGVPKDVTVKLNNFQISAIFKTYTLANKPSVTAKYGGVYKS